MKKNKNKYNIVTLFSGAGGMDLGFIKSGFNVLWANDFNQDAVNTYKQNIGDHIVCGDITKVLCGATRPIHFRGVTTIVSKLFNLTQPDKAYFGQKDAQQVQVLTRMVKDLFLPVKLRIMPIIREQDGLAKSSRNTYLSQKERMAALILSKSLKNAEQLFANGQLNAQKIVEETTCMIKSEPLAEIDYVKIYAMPELTPVDGPMSGRNLLALAVKFGKTRLIDNIILEVK